METKILNMCLKHIIIVNIVNNFAINSQHKDGMFYIGEWTPLRQIKLGYPDLQIGQHGFITRNCSFTNCFYTNDRHFSNLINYDVLLFDVKTLSELNDYVVAPPNRSRSINQKYIFIGFEPAMYFPIGKPQVRFDWTWTYKLSSDVVRTFFIVKNNRNEVIGPRKDMFWETEINDMEPVDKKIESKVNSKKYAAAFIASLCDTKSGRQEFVEKLQIELAKYGQRVDIYGSCGQFQCETKNRTRTLQLKCSDVIQKDYYFYLAFEEAFGEDFVTNQVLYALNNYAVPVVYGGANYTRFLANGIYLNARWLGIVKLARKMMDIINNKQRYYDFFRWHRYYSFHDINTDNQHYDGICDLCAILNTKTRSPKKEISKFWNVLPVIELSSLNKEIERK